ncbi:hypothetical protein ASF31_02120 [Brevundimonas sp. Leaf280]|uniref:hypothetical protein n=1 Tax=Brevundimonas sp. Leaf280 TaxID=1736320 RepID=UPI0006F2C532|nr:hypothetical protein [Brevundimonas sp. Leaf280]KQP48159.1 hypothetical protein ASF31_02120 [Brevundimonas sp. Leaf280]
MTQAAPVYRVRSQEIWDMARDDYLAGEPARIVCRRYDLGLSAFRIRARKGKWRRGDQDDPDLYDPALELEAVEDIAFSDMADTARRRLQLALMDGEATEVQRWLRIFETLSSMASQTSDVHTLHPEFSSRPSDRTDAPAPALSTEDAGSESGEVHRLHPVLSSDDANPFRHAPQPGRAPPPAPRPPPNAALCKP